MRALASCAARRHALGSALQGAVRACARRRRRRTRGRALRGNLQRSEARGLAACEALPLQCAAACAAVRTTPPRSCTAAGAAITSACCCWAGAPRLCRSGTCTAPRCATRWRMGRWRRRRCCWLRQARLHVHAAQARRTRHVACHHRRPRVPRRCRVRARCPARNPPMEAAAEAFAPLALRAALAAAKAHAARARSVPGGGRRPRPPRGGNCSFVSCVLAVRQRRRGCGARRRVARRLRGGAKSCGGTASHAVRARCRGECLGAGGMLAACPAGTGKGGGGGGCSASSCVSSAGSLPHQRQVVRLEHLRCMRPPSPRATPCSSASLPCGKALRPPCTQPSAAGAPPASAPTVCYLALPKATVMPGRACCIAD